MSERHLYADFLAREEAAATLRAQGRICQNCAHEVHGGRCTALNVAPAPLVSGMLASTYCTCISGLEAMDAPDDQPFRLRVVSNSFADPEELEESRRQEDVAWHQRCQGERSVLQDLLDSRRVMAEGRRFQKRMDVRLIEARLLDLYRRGESDLSAVLLIDELNALRDQITATE